MNNTLKIVEFSWEFESCSDACLVWDDNGLDISFMVFLGDINREKTLDDYLVSHNLTDKLDIPDEIYNNAGHSIAHFKFEVIGKLLLETREAIPNDGDYIAGVYEEFDEENKWVRYVFLGHDWAVSVYADKYTLFYEDMLVTPK